MTPSPRRPSVSVSASVCLSIGAYCTAVRLTVFCFRCLRSLLCDRDSPTADAEPTTKDLEADLESIGASPLAAAAEEPDANGAAQTDTAPTGTGEQAAAAAAGDDAALSPGERAGEKLMP